LHPERAAHPHAKRPKVTARAIDLLIEKAWAQGWWCKKRGNNHVIAYSPDGRYLVTLPSSPSDHRSIRNSRLLLKKYGLDLKG
jgi:hypothetical protein